MEAHNVCSSAIVAQVLTGEDNYENWRACIKNYLWVRDLWDVVEQTSEPSQQEDEAEFMAWSKRNVSALHAIQISCDPIMLSHIRNMTSAKDAWNTLAQVCQLPMPQDAPQITEDAPQIIEDAPQITEDAPQIVEDAPQITEDAPQITEDAPQIPAVGDVERTRILAFLEAVKRCDLEATKNLLNAHPHFANTEIPGSGQTTLHFAIFEGQLEMINGLLNTMSNQYLKKRDFYGRTALHYVAMSSENAKVAQSLIRKEKQLLTTPDNGGEIPLNYACWIGHKDMTHYLYNMTPREFLLSQGNECYSAGLVVECIRYKWFDVVWHLLRDHPNLAFAETKNGLNAVSILSSQPSAFPSGNRLSFWQRWIYSCLKVKQPSSGDDFRINTYELQDRKETKNFGMQVAGQLLGLWSNLLKFFGIKQIYDLKQAHVYAHEILLLMSKTITTETSQLSVVREAILNAARWGITEFIVEIVKSNIDLLMTLDSDLRSIFHIAIAHRQENVFGLIYGLDNAKYNFIPFCDKNDNNMLHLAGELSPESQVKLQQISGAALQMQRELQWFKEVEGIIPPMLKLHTNGKEETPYETFDRSHANLVKEGEKWMKDIAQTSTVVGTLIITIMFAALFTVPGGPDQDTGVPLLLRKKLFKIFIISDSISLFASTTSVLMFVGILTSRYTADDFLKSLPNKLIIGLSSLFISIAAMMVAFSSTVIIMVKGQLEIVIPIVLLAGIPIGLFVWLQFPLLVKIFISTYGPGIFDRKMKWL